MIHILKKDKRYKFEENQLVVLSSTGKVKPFKKGKDKVNIFTGFVLSSQLAPNGMKVKNDEIVILKERNI